MTTEAEWAPAGVWILGRSRSQSQYFKFKPEATLRSVQEPVKHKGLIKISVIVLVVVKQNGIN